MGNFFLIREYFDYILPGVQQFHWAWYAGVFFLSFFETFLTVGIFVPGLFFFLLIGLFAALGYLDPASLVFIAMLGAFVGDVIGYYIGKKHSAHFFEKRHFLYQSKYIAHAEAFFIKHGALSIAYSRLIGSLRPFVPFVAGARGVSMKRFAALDLCGGFLWSVITIGVGYLFGGMFAGAIYWSNRAAISILLLAGILWTNIYFFRFLSHRKEAIVRFASSFVRSIKEGLRANEYIGRFVSHYPRATAFLKNRLSPDYYFGLHVTLGFFTTAFFLYLFVVILSKVIFTQSIIETDARIAHLVHIFYNDALSEVMLLVTILGQWQVVLTLALVVMFGFALRRAWYAVFAVVAGIIGSELLAFLLKYIIQRERPDFMWSAVQTTGYSFPSAHAVIAVSFYGLLGYFAIVRAGHWKTKILLLLGGIFFVVMMGVSRVYLSVHYPSDVAAGYLLGLAWLSSVVFALEVRRKFFPDRFARHAKQQALIGKRPFVVLMAVLLLAEGALVFFLFRSVPLASRDVPVLPPAALLRAEPFDFHEMFGAYSRYSEDIFGVRMAPLNFLLIGKERDMRHAFLEAGWNLAEKNTLRNTLKIYIDALLDKPYPHAPVTPSFLGQKVHDFAYQKFVGTNSVRERHHIRIWRLPYILRSGEEIFGATASFDKGIKLYTHVIDPAIDVEREIIRQELLATGMVASSELVEFVEPQLGRNFAGDQFFTDGKLYIIQF